MQLETKKRCAELLRAAATQTIAESDFWAGFKTLVYPIHDPFASVAYESAIHYWGNFHERNLLLIPTKPDQFQLQQGKDELRLIADALDADWPVEDLKRKLRDI